MKVEEIPEWLEKHKQDKTYQHTNLSWAQIDQLALASFAKLTPEQKAKILKVCKVYGFIDSTLIMRVRFMAQTNLFALCKLLGYSAMTDWEYTWTDGTKHSTHAEICNEFFVRKNPVLPTFKDFATQYIDKKERLLLVPRG